MPERDCAKCTASQREDWGCEAKKLYAFDGSVEWSEQGRSPLPLRIMDQEYYGCPRRPMLDDPATYGHIMNLYGHYKNGFLPESGGIMDQPAALMTYFVVIADQVQKCEAQKAENDPKPRPLPPSGRG